MNVLLTSVGRRAYMVKYFKDLIKPEGEVHVCNSDDMTVAFQYADKAVVSPLIYSDDYIPFLVDYCKNNHINILISLFDIDLYILAKNKKKFEEVGTTVIVSEPELIEKCNDKWGIYLFLKDNAFNVPKTYLTLDSVMKALKSGEIKYPVIVKPRFGCGSIALSVADDEKDLLYLYEKGTKAVSRTYLKYESASVDEKIIFQEMLDGQEYGVDIMNDLRGNVQNAVVKKKIAMRAGETDIAQTVDEPSIYKEALRLGSITHHIGNMDCDFFLVDGVPYVLELNARFGGGYPFSHVAGCNMPKAIVQWYNGETPDRSLFEAKTGVLTFKELEMTCRK